MNVLKSFLLQDQAATALEYALIALFIAGVIVGAVTALGLKTLDLFSTVENAF